MGDDERRLLVRLDDVRHRERLAGAGDAEEDLALIAALETFRELGDRPGLVPLRRVGRVKLERRGRLIPREQGPRARRRGALGASAQPALGHDLVRSRYVRTNGFSGAHFATNSNVVASFFVNGVLGSRISQSP